LYIPFDISELKRLEAACQARDTACPDLRSKLDSFLVREFAAVWSWRGAVAPGEDAMKLIVSQLWLLGGAGVTPLLEPSTSVRVAAAGEARRGASDRRSHSSPTRASSSFLSRHSNRPQMFLSDAPAATVRW
jgi:hypothetical protein